MSETLTPPEATFDEWEPEVKVKKRRTFAKDPETGATLNADGRPRAKRGSGEKPRKRKQAGAPTPEEVRSRAELYAGFKYLIAMATKIPEFIATEEGALKVGAAIIPVEREFDFELDSKTAAIAGLIVALIADNTKGAIAFYTRMQQQKPQPAPSDPHANNDVDDPSQMPGYQYTMAAE